MKQLPLRVVEGTGASLLGRDWFPALEIEIKGIHHVAHPRTLDAILDQYQEVFHESLGEHTGHKVHLPLIPGSSPKFLKCRQVPFALRTAVCEELDKLQEQGVLEAAQASAWATPVVVVRKKDGSLRLCGDYRSTVNTCIQSSAYPLPTTTEPLATLSGGKIFSKIDLSQANQQLRVDDETAEILTITTIKVLFRVKRLPFGVSLSPLIFQQFMDSLFLDLDGIITYLDDILITGATESQHLDCVATVLKRLQEAGLKAKKKKCIFLTHELDFLGYHIGANGVSPSEEKLQAIAEAPEPKDKTELQSFLGMITFYHRFIKDRATVAEKLHCLLDKTAKWHWGSEQQEAFNELKQILLSSTILQHFDGSKPLYLSFDASPYGVGAVLAQKDDRGYEVPVAYASRTLGKCERNYAQLDKEGLAIIFGVKHFHQYVAGREVIICTDHKPLLGIRGSGRQIPQILSPRMLRWCLLLGAYDYKLQYRPGTKHQNADALSRLPLPSNEDEPYGPGDVLMIEALQLPLLTAPEIAKMMSNDQILSIVHQGLHDGDTTQWIGPEFTPFITRQNELSTHKGCVLWGSRVVLPKAAQENAMRLLHSNHRGMTAMKQAARSHFCWPSLDRAVETFVRLYSICQPHARLPPAAVLPKWTKPTEPWKVLRMDFAGPTSGQSFLIVVDAATKWLEVRHMVSTTARALI